MSTDAKESGFLEQLNPYRKLVFSSIGDRNCDISLAFMEENKKFLITATFLSSPQISLNMKPNIRCRFQSNKVQCYQLFWVQVIRASSGTSSSNRDKKERLILHGKSVESSFSCA